MWLFNLQRYKPCFGLIAVGLWLSVEIHEAGGQSTQPEDRKIAQDPSPRVPPPDDPGELDVAKRHRFRWELRHQRLGGFLFDMDELLRDAAGDVPEETKTRLLERWSSLLAADMKAAHTGVVRWYGQWVHYLPDPEGKLTLDLIVAEWSVRGVLVRASELADSPRYASIAFRLPKREGLRFRPRPPESEFTDVVDFMKWQFVSKTELPKVLTELFALPYQSDAEFGVHGHVETCAGVEVFAGEILGRRGADSRPIGIVSLPPDGTRWAAPGRILITDSDPQYLCLSFDLNAEAPGEAQAP
jgi:hypothetical protein